MPGYNNHTSLIQAESYTNGVHEDVVAPSKLLVFSAHDKPTLKRNLEAYSKIGDKANLLDLSYTLACRRTKHEHRTFAICRKETYDNSLETALDNAIEHKEPSTVAFIFTGQT